MLHITDKQLREIWHVGDPMPVLTGRVVTFEADGDELALILDAMKSTRKREVYRTYMDYVQSVRRHR